MSAIWLPGFVDHAFGSVSGEAETELERGTVGAGGRSRLQQAQRAFAFLAASGAGP